MKNEERQGQVMKVFIGVEAHQETAALIRSHSTNQRDIREVSLTNLDLQQCRRILDMGCGFGFFSEALRNKVPPTAHLTGLDMIPAYEPLFLEVCKRIGVQGRFLAAPVSHVHTLPERSWDLVLCSYALYFFPEIIPRIARLLTPAGIFVTITHAIDKYGRTHHHRQERSKKKRLLVGSRAPAHRRNHRPFLRRKRSRPLEPLVRPA